MARKRPKDEIMVWKAPNPLGALASRVCVEIPNGCTINVMADKIRISFFSKRPVEEVVVDILGRPLLTVTEGKQ